jgi:hypothetical protein
MQMLLQIYFHPIVICTDYGHTMAKSLVLCSPPKYLGCGYKAIVFCRNNDWLTENWDKGLTVPKWMPINWPKIPQMPQNLSAKFVCPSPKVLDFNEKRLHWASVVRGDMHRHLLFRFLWQVHENGYCFSSWVLGFCAKLRACAVPHLDLATTKIESDIPIEYDCILSIIQIYGNLKLPHVPHPGLSGNFHLAVHL